MLVHSSQPRDRPTGRHCVKLLGADPHPTALPCFTLPLRDTASIRFRCSGAAQCPDVPADHVFERNCRARRSTLRGPHSAPAAPHGCPVPRRLRTLSGTRRVQPGDAGAQRCHDLGSARLSGPVLQPLRLPGADMGGATDVSQPGQPPAGHRTGLGGRGGNRPRRRKAHRPVCPRRVAHGRRNLLGSGHRARPPHRPGAGHRSPHDCRPTPRAHHSGAAAEPVHSPNGPPVAPPVHTPTRT